MKNVIFLDVDGVLTYANFENERTKNIDIEKVRLLKRLSDLVKSDGVVITSSWRGTEKYRPKMYDILIEILKENKIIVLGDAPHISLEFVEGTRKTVSDMNQSYTRSLIKFGTGRAAEIFEYIKENNVQGFIILDDEDFEWADYGFENMWIKTSYQGNGLEEKHVKEAIKRIDGFMKGKERTNDEEL